MSSGGGRGEREKDSNDSRERDVCDKEMGEGGEMRER